MNIFNSSYKGYDLDYCQLCETFSITCPECSISSCSGGGCEKCTEIFTEFSQRKHIHNYLTPEENETFSKISRLQRLLKICYENDKIEIDWQWHKESGHLAPIDEVIFKNELE